MGKTNIFFGNSAGETARRRTARLAVCALFTVALAGCGGGPSLTSWFSSDDNSLTENVKPAETIYKAADDLIAQGSYEEAAKQFEEVDRQHPYSPLARKAIVMAAFAHYKKGDYAQAIAGGRRYVTLHPGTKETALAQHIIASAYFDQINGPRNDQTLSQKALKELQILVRRHPDSRYTAKAKNRILIVEDVLAASEMRMRFSAFAHYKKGDYAQAIAGGRRYVTLHPGTKETALAQHIIASAYFDQINGPRNDQTLSQKALKELQILVRRHPDSRYTAKAKNRILIVEDVLAASEMNVGRFYQKRKNYLAAINRFKTVIQKYQTTAHVKEALLRVTESYLALGVVPEAETAAAVLGHNFPESKWYRQAYALLQSGGHAPKIHSGSWMASAWKTTVAGVKAMTPF